MDLTIELLEEYLMEIFIKRKKDMKEYIGTKRLKATPMSRFEYNDYRGWKTPFDENNDEGYLVEYLDSPNKNHEKHDNYISWSPKEVFEEAYRETEAMTFGLAIEAMKKGAKVSRLGWNGVGMYAYYVGPNSFPSLTEHAKKEFGEFTPYRAYLALKTAQNDVATWNPSTSDCLAEDWIIVI